MEKEERVIFEGQGMYVVMYKVRDTGEEIREAVHIYAEVELNELLSELKEQYEDVEIYTLEEAERLELYNIENFC